MGLVASSLGRPTTVCGSTSSGMAQCGFSRLAVGSPGLGAGTARNGAAFHKADGPGPGYRVTVRAGARNGGSLPPRSPGGFSTGPASGAWPRASLNSREPARCQPVCVGSVARVGDETDDGIAD